MSTDADRPAGIRIARIGGVPVYIGPSWLILAVIIMVLIGPQVAESREDLSPAAAYGVGAAYALLLLVAVLVHEAAHAVTARAFGYPVHRVVADLWGGHTALDVSRARPGASAMIALAGPASNLVIWGVARSVASGMESGIPAGMADAMAYLNGVLALFNLLPGLPLDGGQVVEALVWRITGSRARGRTVAGYCGLAIAAVVLWWVIGRPLLAGHRPGFGTMWGLLIAYFLWQGARQAVGWGKATRQIEGVRIVDVLTPVVAVDSRLTVAEIPTGLPPVVVDASGRPVALVDAAALTAAREAGAHHTPVGAVSVAQPEGWVLETDPNGPLQGALGAFAGLPSGIVAVTQGGRLLGVLTASRVNQAFGEP